MPNNINRIFKAVADPTRREIFHVLVVTGAALSITQIASKFDMTRQGVTKHIKFLEDAGLVKLEQEGRERFCYPNAKPLKELNTWISSYQQFWDDSLDSLDDFLSSKTS